MNRLHVLSLLAVTALCAAGCGGGEAKRVVHSNSSTPSTSTRPPAVRMARVGTFDSPVLATAVPGTDEIAVVEKTGRVRIAGGMTCAADDNCPRRPVTRGRVAIDLSKQVSRGSEQGLLGFAFHPNWPNDPRVYLDFTDRAGTTHVEEWHIDGPRAHATRTRELLEIVQPQANHNGGGLAFGPKDGLLYIGSGDGGGEGDPGDRGQTGEELLGKMLRIDVDADPARGYAIPKGNLSSTSLVWALGLRNPWRFSFDQRTGDLWIGDVGQDRFEEIDAIRAKQIDAGTPNFGWRRREGFSAFVGTGATGPGTLTPPLLDYSHADGCSVTGGYVYRGSLIPRLQGWYVFADYCGSTLRFASAGALDASTRRRGAVHVVQQRGVEHISSFGETRNNELLVTTTDGGVYEVVAAR